MYIFHQIWQEMRHGCLNCGCFPIENHANNSRWIWSSIEPRRMKSSFSYMIALEEISIHRNSRSAVTVTFLFASPVKRLKLCFWAFAMILERIDSVFGRLKYFGIKISQSLSQSHLTSLFGTRRTQISILKLLKTIFGSFIVIWWHGERFRQKAFYHESYIRRGIALKSFFLNF